MNNYIPIKKGVIQKKDVVEFLDRMEKQPINSWSAADAMMALFIITNHVELVGMLDAATAFNGVVAKITAEDFMEKYEAGESKEFTNELKEITG